MEYLFLHLHCVISDKEPTTNRCFEKENSCQGPSGTDPCNAGALIKSQIQIHRKFPNLHIILLKSHRFVCQATW